MTDSGRAGVLIRAAEFSDAAILALLMSQLGYETRVAEMEMRLQSILLDSRYRTLVAVVDGRVCGMIGTFCHFTYEHNDPSARILALVVEAQARGRGVGRALIQAAEDDLAARNMMRLSVDTRLTRKEAHLFYERLGYEKNGFRFVKTLPVQAD
ncbi:MAG TPA: GNAT family N-acetyltransferase [Chthoniobacterales bacterium]